MKLSSDRNLLAGSKRTRNIKGNVSVYMFREITASSCGCLRNMIAFDEGTMPIHCSYPRTLKILFRIVWAKGPKTLKNLELRSIYTHLDNWNSIIAPSFIQSFPQLSSAEIRLSVSTAIVSARALEPIHLFDINTTSIHASHW